MKYIKNNIRIIIAFIITIILTSSVSIYAATKYNSSEVLYEVANSNDITVEAALNDLYTKNTQTLQNLLTRIAALENNSSSGSGTTDFNSIYPVGSIYISASSTNPATLFGGTWVQLKDRFLLGAGDTYSLGATGGEATHLLTNTELPANIGTFTALNWNASSMWMSPTGIVTMKNRTQDRTMPEGSFCGEAEYTLSGGNQAHNNMPPYLTVYMWKRTGL